MNSIITTLNSFGIHFWKFAVEMFIQSTILIVLLFAIDFFLRKRVHAVFRYFMWLLVLAKLLLIINVASPVGIETWLNKLRPAKAKVVQTTPVPDYVSEPKIVSRIIDQPVEIPYTLRTGKAVSSVQEPVVAIKALPINKLPPLNWQGYIFLFWCTGILIFVVLLIQRLFFIKGLIGQTKIADDEINDLFEKCCKTININSKKIKLKISSNMVSPAVCGLFRPSILLPDYLINKLNSQQLRAVILHELSHIRRYDLPMNFLQTALQIIYFYNPFVWLANNIIRKIREQAVDEAVLVALDDEASGYSSTLIDVAEMAFFRPALGLRLIGVVESKKALSQRIRHILNRPMPKTAKLGFTGVLVLIIIAALVLPMAKAEEGNKSKIQNHKSKILHGLQEKIDKARDGDIIIVQEGVYTGNLTITKPITLKGKNAKKCVIEFLGDVPAIFIKKVKNVNIENITLRWSPESTDKRLDNPAAIAVRDANVVMKSCVLEPIDRPKTTPYGLLVKGRSDVTFTRGQTKGFAYAVMFTDGGNGTVSDSFLEGAGHSVVTLHADSKVAITGNILARCGYHAVRNTGGTMEMKNNLVIDNNRAGAYLGNRSAHGIIENNLFTRNRGAIWAYANSDVKIVNNLFINSKNAAIGFQASCKLKIDKNNFVNNPTALIRYKGKNNSNGRGATIGENHYWKNEKNNVDLKGNEIEITLSGDPKFKNPGHGDFSLGNGSVLGTKRNVIAGLTNPNIINSLWKFYTKRTNQKLPSMQRESGIPSSATIQPSKSVPPKARGRKTSDIPSVLKYGDGKADGRKSLAGSGEMIRFTLPVEGQTVKGIKIHGSRYGYPKPPDKDFTIYFLNENKSDILQTEKAPYALFKKGKAKWVPITFKKSVKVPKIFWIALDFKPQRTKGVYVSYDTSTGGQHSMIGLPGQQTKKIDFNGDWMIEVMLSDSLVSASAMMSIPGMPEAKANPEMENPHTTDEKVKFVRLVVAPDEMTFEGIKTTWENLPALLDLIPDKKNTVFELADEYNYNNEGAFVEVFGKAVRLGRKYKFKYVSNIGKKMLGSKGTVQYKGKLQFNKKIPIELITGTVNQSDTLKTQWIKFKQSKDGLVAELNFETKKNSETHWRIRVSIHNGEKYKEKDIIYNTKNNTTNLFYVFDNKNLHPDEFQISIEQFPLPLEQVSINSTFTVKSVEGPKTNIIDILSQPQVTVLMGMKAEIVVGNENPIRGSEKEFSGLKAEFLPKNEKGNVTLSGKLSVTDKTKTKEDSDISWNSKKGTETDFKIEKVIPGKEYIISPVPYDKNSFLEIKLIVSGFENKFLERIVDNIDSPFVDELTITDKNTKMVFHRVENERKKILSRIVQTLEQQYKNGQLSDSKQLFDARIKLLNAEIDLCKMKRERIAFLDKIVQLHKDEEDRLAKMYACGRVTQLALDRAAVSRLEAQEEFANARDEK